MGFLSWPLIGAFYISYIFYISYKGFLVKIIITQAIEAFGSNTFSLRLIILSIKQYFNKVYLNELLEELEEILLLGTIKAALPSGFNNSRAYIINFYSSL